MTATPKPSGLRSDSTIAVLIPHFRCEEWLGGCLDSLLAQTRAPEAIIVIDDASPVPPTECVKQFPGVTLLQSAENVGPYRLIQQVIDHTAFDGYMFQDADDWSGSRRLELLLAECERSGAELVGCQEMRLFPGGIDAEAHRFPADGRELILSGAVGYPVLHPASLVSRSLVVRLGSYATGMRISGDSEFQRRAIHSAHVTNIPEIAYYRRARADSLTSSSVTGRGTPVRNAIRVALSDRWKEARAAVDAGMAADLSPMSVRGPVELRHLTGPKLTGSRVAPTKRSWRQRREFQRGRRVWRGLSANLYHWSSWIRPRSPLCGARTSSEAVARPRSRLAHSPGRRSSSTVSRSRDHCPGCREPRVPQDPRSHAALSAGVAFGRTGGDRVHTRSRRPRRIDILGGLVDFEATESYGRWVDGSSLYALHIEKLLDLFPGARFVNVLREPDWVVRSIMLRGPRQNGAMTPVEAYTAWTQHVEACMTAERLFGSAVIHRVFHRELRASAEISIRAVLEFIGEPFASACITPVSFFAADESVLDSRQALDPLLCGSIGSKCSLGRHPSGKPGEANFTMNPQATTPIGRRYRSGRRVYDYAARSIPSAVLAWLDSSGDNPSCCAGW